MIKKFILGVYLTVNLFLWAPLARAEYPIHFAEMVIALLKEKTAQEKKLTFYGKANDAMKSLIEEAIGTKGTVALHKEKGRIREKEDLEKARAFLNFETSMTQDFILKQIKKKEGGGELNLEDFIAFVEEYFFLDNEKKGFGKDEVPFKELDEIQKKRQAFFDETLREAYAYAFINRGYSSSEGTNKLDIINEIKAQSDEDKTLREALYTNNRALQELIFETMQMIMFEQIALEIEAAEQLQGTAIPLLKYDYKKGVEDKEKKTK